MNNFKIDKVYIYYDGPQVVILEDDFNTSYLACASREHKNGIIFTAVPITKKQVTEVESGQLELRLVFTSLKARIFSLICTENGDYTEFGTKYLPTDLPDSGLFIKYNNSEVDCLLYSQINRCGIIAIGFQPQESKTELRIPSQTLADGLAMINSLVLNGLKKATQSLSKEKKLAMKDYIDNFKLDIIAVQHGSFRVLLRSQDKIDKEGHSDLEIGMALVDEMMDSVNNKKSFVSSLRKNKGNLVNSVKTMADFIKKHDCPFYYTWVTPSMEASIKKEISVKDAVRISAYYLEIEKLDGKKIELEGEAIKADKKNGSWTLFNEKEKNEYSGIIARHGVHLKGITIGSLYKFKCNELIEHNNLTGKNKTKLLLNSYEAIN